MSTAVQEPARGQVAERLPRRDYVILPLLSLLTVLVLLAGAEVASRIAFVQHEKDACMMADPVLGTRFRPNCTSDVKAAEGPWVTNHYNACGFRSPQPCGAKPAGSVRVAVLGSSIAQGYLVPYQQTFAARAAAQLTQACHTQVQFQNLASIGYVWGRLADRVDAAIDLHPDAAVIAVVPFDLQQSEYQPNQPARAQQHSPGPLKTVESLLENSRAVVAAQHFLFRQPGPYVRLYLQYGDRADFLRPPFSQAWQQRLSDFDHLMAGIAAKFRAAGIPVTLVFVPERAQAALLSAHHAPSGVNPWAFGQEIGAIAHRNGIGYVDMSEAMSRIPDAANLYYPVDGHLSGQGNKFLARLVAQQLQRDVPALTHCGMSMARGDASAGRS